MILSDYKFVTLFLVLQSVLLSTVVSQTDRPNVLVIVADDLGNDAIEDFGIDLINFPNTPNIQGLRDDGVSFLNAWATPQCTPTRAAIISGKYGVNTGVQRAPGNLGLEHESIFTYLNRNTDESYKIGVIGKWHISNPVNLNHPFEHGVDHFEGIINGTISDYYNWEKVENGQFVQTTEYVTTDLTNSAINWIGQQEQPWFLWLAHIAPHSPFHTPPDGLYSGDEPVSNRQKFIATIEALDSEIGRLLNSMDKQTRQNTVVVFLGDNGTANGIMRGYPTGHGKGSMYEGGLRVPMIISGSGVNRKGEDELGLSQVNDLYATLIEICSNDLEGGIYNSYSLRESLSAQNTIERQYVYADYIDDGMEFWAIRNTEYKLIENESGIQEFYRIDNNIDELDNLIGNMTAAEAAIMTDLEEEALAIRSGWSCRDFILNGDEITIDDCNSTGCTEVDVLSATNIGCCDSPDVPSVYYEFLENNERNIYSNGFPDHDYCYNPNNIPVQTHHFFRVNRQPQIASEPTNIIRDNGRPARHFGVALNGVVFSPAPGTPFIYVDKNTGEFNWDWVFEPTTNQGDGTDQVRLDCATAHTNASGYHYHGEMFEYLETIVPGITDVNSLDEVIQVGWASDGYPIIYKFGPDATGAITELQPSFQLKAGERPGDGITAPCGPYTGKYTNDFEYVEGIGDLDECNGIAANITLETALGNESFDYYYVVTSTFPQIGRCLVGTVSPDFENTNAVIKGVDEDNDGFLAQFDCDDTDPTINPNGEEIANNGIDENCDGTDLITTVHELSDAKVDIFPNPTTGIINIKVQGDLNYALKLFDAAGNTLLIQSNQPFLDMSSYPIGIYLLELEDLNSGAKLVERISKTK